MNQLPWLNSARAFGLRPLAACLTLMCTVAVSAPAKDRWMKVSTPYQTILTSSSVSDAKEWAACLEVYRQSLQSLAPTDNRMLDPMVMVIFKNEKAFVATAATARETGLSTTMCRFVSVDGRFLGAVNPVESDAARHAVFLQSSLWLTSSYRWPLPLWLVTGLQYVYAEYSVSGNRMEIGAEVEESAQSLKGGLLMPVDRMWWMTTYSPTYQAKDGHFNAQAWAFVHFMMFGENGANRPRLAQFMQAIQRGEDMTKSEALLAPKGMDDLTARFTRYVRTGVYRYEAVPIDLEQVRKQVSVQPASDTEVNLALGYLTLHFQGEGPATPYFERAAKQEPASAATLEALGELAGFRNEQLDRNRYYAEAVAAGSSFHLARFYALYPALQSMSGSEAAGDGTDPVEARKAFDGMKSLLRARPAFLIGHQWLALIAASLHEVNDDDGALLREGEKLYPREAVMVAGVAAYEITAKKFVWAKRDLDRLKAGTWDNQLHIEPYIEKLDGRLEAANTYYWLEKFAAEGNFENVDKLLADQRGLRRLLPGERERVQAIRSTVGAKELLVMARSSVARKQWDGADSLVAQVEYMKLGGEVGKEAAELRAAIEQGRRAAKPR